MKASFVTATALLAMAAASRAQECNLDADVLSKIDFENIAARCEFIAGDQSFETCDACLGAILGDLLLPLYPSLGLDVTTFPTSPALLAQALAGGDDVGLAAFSEGGPCSDYLTEQAEAANADVQAYFFSIIGCDATVGWGPQVIEAVTEFNPDFVATPARK